MPLTMRARVTRRGEVVTIREVHLVRRHKFQVDHSDGKHWTYIGRYDSEAEAFQVVDELLPPTQGQP
jgi:hypothetical protein